MNVRTQSVCALLTASLSLLSFPAHAVKVTGFARVIDGDTIALGTQVIRLYGIDAPENGQDCQQADGRFYNCGAEAESRLTSLLNKQVSCSGTEYDRYQRLIATCTSDGIDVSRTLVSTGYALAYRQYSTRYIAEEKAAASNKRGMWAGSFVAPWEFRSEKWKVAAQQAPAQDCPIKGNINRDGERIYHTPWSRSYSRTRINTANSERWFCSEADALAAGWRAPHR